MRWAGIDVGAERKGFHVAVIDGDVLVERPRNLVQAADVVALLQDSRPVVVAVDSPRSAAVTGERSRGDERRFAAARICGIRYTPHLQALAGSTYYAWVRNGFLLYDALLSAAPAHSGWTVIECFPTAAWACLGGERHDAPRSRWSARVLGEQRLHAVPPRLNQDERDAIAAALTARMHANGETECFGEIVVPRPRSAAPDL